MMAAIVHTFSPTSTRHLHNLRNFLYNVQVLFFGLHIANVGIIEFYFLGLEVVEGARELSTWDERYARTWLERGFFGHCSRGGLWAAYDGRPVVVGLGGSMASGDPLFSSYLAGR
jgi:hypothetical protein